MFSNIVIASTYYSNNGDPSLVNKWWTNTNGTGAHPSNFTTSGDIFILQSGQTCTTGNNNDWTVGSGVTLRVNGTLSISGNNSDVIITGTIIFTSTNSAQVILAGAGSGNSITINGTVKTANVNGLQGSNCSLPVNAFKKTVTYGASATYEFNAASSQSTLGLPSSIVNLIINGSSNVTINASTTITGTLTLTSGIMVIPTGMTINVTSGNTIAGSGFGNSKHINTQVNTGTGAQGFMRVGNISTTYTFPTGNGTYYLPATLAASGTNDYSVNVFQGATTNGTPNGTAFGTAIKKTIVDAIWVVNRNSGSASATMQLSWPGALEGSIFSTYTNSSIGISHYGGTWDMFGGSGDQAANTAARNAISSFSPFMIGESGVPLSLKFGDIKLSLKNNNIQVEWISLTEVNVDHYEIERSTDKQQFMMAGQIKAIGNNSSEISYSWLDAAQFSNTIFYRIKAVDNGGQSIYSRIVTITTPSAMNKNVSVYPNPVQNNRTTIEAKNISAGQYQLIVYDINGRQLYLESFDHPGGTFSKAIQLPGNVKSGIYSLKLIGRNVSLIKTFVVQ